MRHPELVHYCPNFVVRKMAVPCRVGHFGFTLQIWIAFFESEIENVEYGDREYSDDEVEGDCEQHQGGGRGAGEAVVSLGGCGAVGGRFLVVDEELLTVCESFCFTEDENVEEEDGQWDGSEDEHLRDPGIDGPHGAGSCIRRLRSQLTLVGCEGEEPEVSLNGVEGEWEGDEASDGNEGALGGAESIPLEGVTDGDVTFDGESKNEEGTELLGSEEDDWEELAQAWKMEQVQWPPRLQLEEYLQTRMMNIHDWTPAEHNTNDNVM